MLKEIIERTITNLTYDGLGVASYNDKKVFVNNALPGEVVKIKIIEERKEICYGKVIEIIKPSKDRVEPICKYFKGCGSCTLMHLEYNKQLEEKKRFVKEAFKRIGKIDLDSLSINVDILGMDNPYYYRDKVQMPFSTKDGRVICGYYKRKTHDTIEIDNCFLQSDNITKVIKDVCYLVNKYKLDAYDENTKEGYLRHLVIRENDRKELMVIFCTNHKKSRLKEVVNELKKTDNIVSIIENINTKNTNVIFGDESNVLYGNSFLEFNILGLKYQIACNSFLQVNLLQTEKLYNTVLEFLRDANVNKYSNIIDCYSGVGSISLLLAKHFKHVYGIEVVKEAITNSNQNRKLNDISNVDFILGKVEEEIYPLLDKGIDAIVFDPPRKGLDKKVIDSVKNTKIKNLVYVSCNYATLARDLSYLIDEYEIKEVRLVDMFPETCDIESVALLVNKTK